MTTTDPRARAIAWRWILAGLAAFWSVVTACIMAATL